MNILILTQQGDMAGSTNSISYLCKGLSEKGHEVYLMCRKEALINRLLTNTKVQLVHLPFRKKIDLKLAKHIAQFCLEHHIDVVNAQSSKDRYLTIQARIFYGMKSKLFFTRRQHPEDIGGFIKTWFYSSFTDRIIVVSESLKSYFLKKGYNEKDLFVIQNGIPAFRFDLISQEKMKEIKNQYQLTNDDFIIGVISRKKNQDLVVKALSLLPIKVVVLLVGIQQGEYDDIISELAIKQRVIYTGDVAPEDVMNYHSLCNIHILPSSLEGLPQTLLESMGCGIPNIGTNVSGIKDVIRNGDNGLLFEDHNIEDLVHKIKLIMNNEQLSKQIAEKGKITARVDFSLENTIKNHEHFFASQL